MNGLASERLAGTVTIYSRRRPRKQDIMTRSQGGNMRLFLTFLTLLTLGGAARADEASRPCDRSNASCRWLATGSPDAEYLSESALDVFRFRLGGFQTPDRVYMVTRSL